MRDKSSQEALGDALECVDAYRQELDETNKGIIALTLELEKKNEEISKTSQQLWQVAKLATMGELSAGIAHELNNPLTTISLRLEGLMEKIPPDDPVATSLNIIAQEVDRMAHLVRNLLDFSRIHTIEFSTVDLREEIERSLELVSYLLINKSIRIERDIAVNLPAIQADRQQLRQVFLNLITNAIDAMNEGGVITVSMRKGDAARQSILVEIRDTGCGIAPENLAKVMEPFFSTKGEGKGTGLGLSICRRIVTGHCGSLDIRSELNTGTTIAIKFPVKNSYNHTKLDPDSCE